MLYPSTGTSNTYNHKSKPQDHNIILYSCQEYLNKNSAIEIISYRGHLPAKSPQESPNFDCSLLARL